MLSQKKKIVELNKNNLKAFSELNRPLRDNFGIYLFTYRKLYFDGRLFQLSLEENWIDKNPDQGFYVSKELMPKIMQTLEVKSNSFLWSGNKSDPLYESLFELNIWNGITFYESKIDHIEMFAYATGKENDQAANFYMNNMDILKHFRTFFKDRLNHILSEDDTKTLSVDVGNYIDIPKINAQFIEKNLAFLALTRLSHYIIETPSKNVTLTPREAEVLFLSSQGKRIKEIAKSLHYLYSSDENCKVVSPRTIEAYWEHIKNKFLPLSRAEILNLFIKSDVCNIMGYKYKVNYLASNHNKV